MKGVGPVLLYQIAEHDTRMFVDAKASLRAWPKVRASLCIRPFTHPPCPLTSAQVRKRTSSRT